MKKLLLFFTILVSTMGLFAQNVGDNAIINYDGYSLEFTVTSVEPAECAVSVDSGEPVNVIIPSKETISGKEYTVTSIGYYAFSNCDNLTSIEIPNSVTSIGDYAFYYCSNLTSITVEEGNPVYDSRNNCNAIIETETNTLIAGCQNTLIPNSVTSIGGSAFYKCYNLTSIEIPNSVTSIGGSAFSDCINLTSIEIPNSVTSIGDNAFNGCSNLTSIEIPNSVTSIGEAAFSRCFNLTNITVENGNPVYDSRNNCNAIIETSTNILINGCMNTIIPDNITTIGYGVFAEFTLLTSIEIPNSVTSIGDYAFYGCSNLTSIEIPNSVTSMGMWVFWNCSNLTSIYCYAENVIVANGMFLDCPSDMIIYVPAQSVDAYKAASPWNEYTILPMGEIVNHWIPDESLYANNMSVIGLIQIDGVNQNSTSLEIGAFCGEEVRGSQLVQYIPELDKYLVFLTIHGDNENDEISFRLYNHETEEELDLRSPEAVTFTVNGTLGSITSPYVLNFSNMVNVTASVNPEIAGSISGSGEYAINDIVTLTATANTGYQFINWTEEGTVVSEEAEYSFTVTESRELVANFELLTYNVTASANPAEGGSISGAGTYTHGETATLSATANTGYQFINWTEEGTIVSEESEYSFTVTESRELVANFELLTYNVTASANPAEGGSISGSGVYTHGETATLSATSNEGYQFINWTEEGTVVSEESEYSFTVAEARELVANFNCVQNRNLKSGWSWFSSYIEISGAEGLEMIEEALGENGLQIKNQTAFVANSSAGWYGSLTSVSVESMYMLQTSATHELTLSGDKVNPENHPITIGTNWKWISYLLSENIDVEEALSTINPSHGDYVKSKNAFSQYYNGIGWIGALNTMNPGEGYMYQNTSGTTKTLVYPSSASKGTRANVTSENNYWIADAGKYANNMNMIAFVKNNSGMDYEIGAFVGEEVRGSARPIYIEALDSYMIFMTIFGESNEEITFKYYDVNNDEEENIFTKENVIFSANAVLGSVDNPIAMMFDTEGIGENGMENISIYPNPANVNSEINLGMTCDRVEIYNTLGVKIAEYSNVNKIDGIETSGVYMIRLTNGEEAINCRIVVE
ncbi:MAG: leucine-rich repeat domain-containing protein [Bacteroidales bacterium]|nr:leucine-rich repeat domain-containing protein [Bacteroidales bacterium]